VFQVKPEDTIFAKIIQGKIPSKKVYEDDFVYSFHDINPAAPVHILILPKKPLGGLSDVTSGDEEQMGHLMVAVAKIAKQEKLDEGYRVVINNGKNGQQSVHWLHVHLLGGRAMTWPPG